MARYQPKYQVRYPRGDNSLVITLLSQVCFIWRREYEMRYQPEIQERYQPDCGAYAAARKLIPSLVRGLIPRGVFPTRLVLYITTQTPAVPNVLGTGRIEGPYTRHVA